MGNIRGSYERSNLPEGITPEGRLVVDTWLGDFTGVRMSDTAYKALLIGVSKALTAAKAGRPVDIPNPDPVRLGFGED